MKVISIDHLVLTVASIARTVAFYERVLGMQAQVFGPENRVALIFGQQQNLQKINLHELGQEFEPKARLARPGTADLCFIVDDFDAIATKLAACKLCQLICRYNFTCFQRLIGLLRALPDRSSLFLPKSWAICTIYTQTSR